MVRGGYSHMGRHSGYDLLADELHSRKETLAVSFIWKSKPTRLNKLILKAASKFWKQFGFRTPFYTGGGLVTELRVIGYAIFRKMDIIHFLYVEDSFCLLGSPKVQRLLRGKPSIIGTIHQPTSWWKVTGNLNLVLSINKIIVLSEYEKKTIGEAVKAPTFFVPHGVSIEYFQPSPRTDAKKSSFSCLFVGNWLRNIELLSGVVELLLAQDPDIIVHLVYPLARQTNDFRLYALARHRQVKFHIHISDDELKDLYQECDTLLLPMIDCTANNAILESIASGLPVITSKLPSLESYLDLTFSFMLPDDPVLYVEAIIKLKYDDSTERRFKAREHALKFFTWQTVGDQIESIYQHLK